MIRAVLPAILILSAPAAALANDALITVEDFAGVLLIETSDDAALSVSVADGSEDYAVKVRESDGRIAIEGEGDDVLQDRGWRGGAADRLRDFPTVTIRAPKGVELEVDDAAILLTAGDLGDVEIRARFLSGSIASADDAEIGVAGSGSFKLGTVGGDLEAGLAGSGDLEVGAVSGEADFSLAGSGDVELQSAQGGLVLAIAGSGDFDAGEVNGETDISIAGSGDVSIKEGRADGFKVSIAGSGDVRFGGVAVNPVISAAGSGDVSLGGYEGSMKTSGNAKVRVRRR